jgi:hypothetical protein
MLALAGQASRLTIHVSRIPPALVQRVFRNTRITLSGILRGLAPLSKLVMLVSCVKPLRTIRTVACTAILFLTTPHCVIRSRRFFD